jgi:hypothetical protein
VELLKQRSVALFQSHASGSFVVKFSGSALNEGIDPTKVQH